MDLILLFVASLLAATLLPTQSELFLAGIYLQGNHSPLLLIVIATCGNVLGSCLNWLLGRYLEKLKDHKWFPIKPLALEKAKLVYKKYGMWALLFAWLPIIGDPMTIAAGLLRTPFLLFLLLVCIGKLARYIAIIALI